MALQVGIVGLPNVGKSTLFNALTQASATVASYPFTTIQPNIGIAEVPDPRLHDIATIVEPERVVPATVHFVDVAGLVRGASQGEGLGNQFLGHIRDVDAIIMVVRCFRDPQVPHVTDELDPVGDIETVSIELALADLDTVERRLERVRGKAKAQPKDYEAELALLGQVRGELAAGHPVRAMSLSEADTSLLYDLNLLTAKPLLYLANVSDDDLPDGGELAQQVMRFAQRQDTDALVISAQLEAELVEWPSEEAAAYRGEVGLERSGLDAVVQAGYSLLNLITFFTTTGGHEVRAWPLLRGSRAIEAAGKVHTDMGRGFIRAEVISCEELKAVGSFPTARERGLVRIEGRDYVVQDGDIIHVRFAV